MAASEGEKTLRFQNLYKDYSRLLLTNPTDRPVAIDGIQQRLLRAFATAGGYGVFDESAAADSASVAAKPAGSPGLFRRSLLWHRPPAAAPLARIRRPEAEGGRLLPVPTWSWMAYLGSIDYLAPKFGSIDWEALRSPWSAGADARGAEIGAAVRTVRALPRDGRGGRLFFDVDAVDAAGTEPKLECVVLGVEQQAASDWWAVSERLHYLLLVAPLAGELRGSGGEVVYERIGAGYLPGWALAEKGEWILIR
jgi:hypothetical protein